MENYTLEEVIDAINIELAEAYESATLSEEPEEVTEGQREQLYNSDALQNAKNFYDQSKLGKVVADKSIKAAKKSLEKKKYDKIAKDGAALRSMYDNISKITSDRGEVEDSPLKAARKAYKDYKNLAKTKDEKERRKNLKEGYKYYSTLAKLESVSDMINEAYEDGVISYEQAYDMFDMIDLDNYTTED